MAPEPVSDLRLAVRRAVRSYFADRRRERRREQVQDWKEAGVYPYEGDPANESEQAERVVFDVVSGALAPHISKGNRAGARLGARAAGAEGFASTTPAACWMS
jgi:hypothetical protein